MGLSARLFAGYADGTDQLLESAVIDGFGRNPRKVSGAPIPKGTRMPAGGIVENYVGSSPVEEIAYNFEIPEATILDVLRYAAERNPLVKL